LDNFFEEGIYNVKLEVVIEDRIFIPLAEEIRFISPVKVKVPLEQHNIEKPDKKITVELAQTIEEMIGKTSKQEIDKDKEIEETIYRRKRNKYY